MRDTPPEVEEFHTRLIMSRSVDERLKMASNMLKMARELAMAGLLANGCDPKDLRAQLFLRFYGDEFPPDERDRIVARLRRYTEETGRPIKP